MLAPSMQVMHARLLNMQTVIALAKLYLHAFLRTLRSIESSKYRRFLTSEEYSTEYCHIYLLIWNNYSQFNMRFI